MAYSFAEFSALGLTYSDIKSSFYDSNGDDDEAGILTQAVQKMDWLDVCSCAVKDVIVLAEFSEIKGPLPIVTIPPSGKNDLNLDIDDFILKIMSIDYQANLSGHFRFTDDTQVLQTDVIEGVHAYVHYFSLNDVRARGFVRPLCLAYISTNKTKLEGNISILKEDFLRVSNIMKYENRSLFLEDVSMCLQHLKDTQFEYFLWRQKQDDNIAGDSEHESAMLNINLDQLIDQQNEFTHILQSPNMESQEIYEILSNWKSVFYASDEEEVIHYINFIKSMLVAKTLILTLQKSNEKRLDELKPIAAICPFGIPIGLWILCTLHQYFHKCILQMFGGCFWDQNSLDADERPSGSTLKDGVFIAVTNGMYLHLLIHLLPFSTSIPENDQPVSSLFNQEKYETSMLTSGCEASSSYYSAQESAFETTTVGPSKSVCNASNPSEKVAFIDPFKESCSDDNVLECDLKQERANGDDWSSDSSVENKESEVLDFPATELWSKCIWGGSIQRSRSYSGQKFLQFFKEFSKVAQHVIYSFLIGRTVVVAGGESISEKVLEIISALVYFVPLHKGEKYLRWHKGILVPAHIEKYKVIGLCVPERLTVLDMISPRDKNYVTILDVNTKKIFGPAYSGKLLSNIEENFQDHFPSDESLILMLQSVFMQIKEKVYLYNAIVNDRAGSQKSVAIVLSSINIRGCDAEIIKYLWRLLLRSYF